jgi:hypothetical protein
MSDEVAVTMKVQLISFVVFVATILFAPDTSAQSFKETFPRIAGVEIGSAFNISHPNYRQSLAKHDILVLGMWKGWSANDDVTGERLNIRDVVVDIKRRAASIGNNGIIIGKYTNFNESSSDQGNSASSDKWIKLHSEVGPGYPRNNDWYARDGNGEHVDGFPGNWLTNVTEYVQRDVNGDTYPEWAVRRDFEEFFRDIPEFDMWYIDNWLYRPRQDADWNGDGVNDDRNLEQVRSAVRQGYVNALRRARELAPGLIFIGNVDGEVSTNSGMLTEPEFRGQIAALYEGAIGMSWSAETWGSWSTMMQQYQTTTGNAQHNLAMMSVHGGEDDYAQMRYGLASCLLDNGYYYYTTHENQYKSALWFDEYDVDLGRAIDPPQFSQWQRGVYMRRFENGMALVNPKGNGTRTVQIGPGYKRFNGSQDPATNNGQIAESVTLRERDGLILVRIGGPDDRTQPKPPQLRINVQ